MRASRRAECERPGTQPPVEGVRVVAMLGHDGGSPSSLLVGPSAAAAASGGNTELGGNVGGVAGRSFHFSDLVKQSTGVCDPN